MATRSAARSGSESLFWKSLTNPPRIPAKLGRNAKSLIRAFDAVCTWLPPSPPISATFLEQRCTRAATSSTNWQAETSGFATPAVRVNPAETANKLDGRHGFRKPVKVFPTHYLLPAPLQRQQNTDALKSTRTPPSLPFEPCVVGTCCCVFGTYM